MKFEKFEIGDSVINFSDGNNDYALRSTDREGQYFLYRNGQLCYENSGIGQWSWMCYNMPTDKDKFKAKARRLVKKITRS